MEAKKKETKVYKSKILNDFFTINDTKAYKRTEKNMLLALRILKAMQTKKLNRIKFAEEMGVHPSVVTKWLSGTHHFTTETLFDIEEKLNIKVDIFTFPNGVYNDNIVNQLIENGYIYSLTTEDTFYKLSSGTSHKILPRIQIYSNDYYENILKINGFHNFFHKY